MKFIDYFFSSTKRPQQFITNDFFFFLRFCITLTESTSRYTRLYDIGITYKIEPMRAYNILELAR